jgi:hypothetical protein
MVFTQAIPVYCSKEYCRLSFVALQEAALLNKYRTIIDNGPVFVTLLASSFNAGIAQLVERCLAKAKVAGSNPVSRSSLRLRSNNFVVLLGFDWHASLL